MGQCATSHLPNYPTDGGRRSSIRRSLRMRMPKPRKKSDISYTFNVINCTDDDAKFEQLNINLASEDELMTLPGINRVLAHNIVEHRLLIGRFRKVDDLALVSGIGATRLDMVRPEVCVSSKRRNFSRSSTVSQSVDRQSMDSFPSTESTTRSVRSTPYKVVNVNSANVFQIMAVPGVNQEIAANIVEYRDRKGRFRTIDDLVKVRGLNRRTLGAIRSFLTVDDFLGCESDASSVSIKTTPQKLPERERDMSDLGVPTTGHRRSLSAPIHCDVINLSNQMDMKEMFEVLSMKSQRPLMEEMWDGQCDGRLAIRIASWNLTAFTSSKAANPGVREVVCHTLLENGIGVLAVHDVKDRDALQQLCTEMNRPTISKIQNWDVNRGEWSYLVSDPISQNQSSHFSGFLYNSSRGVTTLDAGILTVPTSSDSPHNIVPYQPFYCIIQLDSIKLLLVNLYLVSLPNPTLTEEDIIMENDIDVMPLLKDNEEVKISSYLKLFEEIVKHRSGDVSGVLVMGQYSTHLHATVLNFFKDSGYCAIFAGSSYIPLTSSVSHTSQPRRWDGMWISGTADQLFTGNWSSVTKGLSHLAIPSGWSWGGDVSDFCPTWLELFTEQLLPNGDVH